MRQELTSFVVHAWHCDHFGHLNVRNYAAMFDDAIFVFWAKNRGEQDDAVFPVTASLKIDFQSEAVVGTVVRVDAEVGRIGGKSVSLKFEMFDIAAQRALATCDVVEVFFDKKTRESHSIPDTTRSVLQAHFS